MSAKLTDAELHLITVAAQGAKDKIDELLAERDSLRAQLAAAQRVPEDAELDTLDTRARLVATNRYLTVALADAITALRRRVAELTVTAGDVIDAQRYRYLRNDCAESSLGVYEWRGEMGRQVKSWLALHELDDAIDAAIAKEPQDA